MPNTITVFEWDSIPDKAGDMRRRACEAAFNEVFRNQVKIAAKKAGIRNPYRRPLEFIDFLLRDYVYTQDPFAELYQYPSIFHYLQFGDCDCVAIYLMSVLSIIRVKHQMVFQGNGKIFTHVFIQAYPMGLTIDIDPTRREGVNFYEIKKSKSSKKLPAYFNERIMEQFLKAKLSGK